MINFVFLPDSHRSLKTLHPRSRILSHMRGYCARQIYCFAALAKSTFSCVTSVPGFEIGKAGSPGTTSRGSPASSPFAFWWGSDDTFGKS